MTIPRYRRILIKISGEALQDEQAGVSPTVLRFITREILAVCGLGVEVAVVIGGGNIVRGAMISGSIGIDRVTGDYMGMLATVINGMALQSALVDAGGEARLQTALNLEQVAAPYIREKAVRHLERKRVVIFSGGTGNPFFTTDTAAALRAAEIGAEALLKATNVDGVYSGDPHRQQDARRYQSLTMDEAINKKLRVMDATALTLCRDRGLPIHVFRLQSAGALQRILQNEDEGTLLTL